MNLTYFSHKSSSNYSLKKKIFMNLFFGNNKRTWIKCDKIFYLKCKILKKNIVLLLEDFEIKRMPNNLENKAIKNILSFCETKENSKRLGNIKDLLSLINQFLSRSRQKTEVELDSLLLYLFYCIVMASPLNFVSDVKILYMSLAKEDEIRIMGNLAVQLIASLQFLSRFISDICREVKSVNQTVFNPDLVDDIRADYGLETRNMEQENEEDEEICNTSQIESICSFSSYEFKKLEKKNSKKN